MIEKDYLALASQAGRIMLENGAETCRIEDTMMRILNHLDIKGANVFVTTTGLFVSSDEHTLICRIKTRTIHLNKIALVNDMSRRLVSGEISPEEAAKLLEDIDSVKPYRPAVRIAASALSCFCFAFIYGGTPADELAAFFSGAFLSPLLIFLGRIKISGFLTSLFGGAWAALLTLLLIKLGIGENMDKIIIASIMPLVPGVVLTNSVRDILEGDYLSGSGRILDALLVAAAVAAGVGSVLKLYFYFFGGELI